VPESEPKRMELSEEMKAAIGVQGPPVVHEVTAPGIRTFARAVGYRSEVYYDEAAARAQGHPAIPAPPGFFGSVRFSPNAPDEGRRRPQFRSPFRRNLDGGTEIEPIERVYAGDVLEAVTTLANLEIREGRLGPMLVRTSETVYTRRSDGQVVARTRRTGLSY
jgi:hypothetical protein